jgi:hypothetical protein
MAPEANLSAQKSAVVPPDLAVVPQAYKAGVVSNVDSDDEFGDTGLDDSDLEAAEAAATQTMERTGNGLLPVRTRYL